MDKYVTRRELKRKINTLRKKKIVFTNGCFDFCLPNKIKYLQYSKTLGDILIVAVDSDENIKKLKGKKRPIIKQKDRIEAIVSLECVDYVVLFDKKIELLTLTEMLKPDVYTKGGDYEDKKINDLGFFEMHCKEVIITPKYNGFSTTEMIKFIQENEGLT